MELSTRRKLFDWVKLHYLVSIGNLIGRRCQKMELVQNVLRTQSHVFPKIPAFFRFANLKEKLLKFQKICRLEHIQCSSRTAFIILAKSQKFNIYWRSVISIFTFLHAWRLNTFFKLSSNTFLLEEVFEVWKKIPTYLYRVISPSRNLRKWS